MQPFGKPKIELKKSFQLKLYFINGAPCLTSGLQYKKSNKLNDRITNGHLAASREYYRQK